MNLTRTFGVTLITLLGLCFFEGGDLEGASARLQEAKSINEKLGHQSALAVTLDNLGDVLLQQRHPGGKRVSICRELRFRGIKLFDDCPRRHGNNAALRSRDG